MTLRSAQFPEDGGPLAHPPRPDQYREINNFYTATVYEKGAEIVRMLATLLGEAGFRKGMDLYFERHDGEATTIEAFLAVFADANGVDLEQFKTWYLQAGTPRADRRRQLRRGDADLHARRSARRRSRRRASRPRQPLVLPIKFGLIGPNGSPMGWSGVSGAEVRDDMIVLDGASADVTFTGIANRPVPSLFRGFSAPVNIVSSAQPGRPAVPGAARQRSVQPLAGAAGCRHGPDGRRASTAEPWSEKQVEALSRGARGHAGQRDARRCVQGAGADAAGRRRDRPHHRQGCRSRQGPRGARRPARRRWSSGSSRMLEATYRALASGEAYAPDAGAGRPARAAQPALQPAGPRRRGDGACPGGAAISQTPPT